MEVFLKSILYILTFAGAAAVVSFYISDIHMNRKRFRWYYYLPAAAVFAVLGGLCSHIFVWWLYLLSEAGSVSVLLLLGYLIRRGIPVIPKSSSPERMRENLDVCDIPISADDMSYLSCIPETGWSGEHPDDLSV